MKHKQSLALPQLFLLLIIPLCSAPVLAQNTWTSKADLTGDARAFAFSFAIGNKIYVGSGVDGAFIAKNDFWEYDTDANTWTQKANFAGGGRYGAVAFSLNGKGYVGLGNEAYSATMYKDMWEYNPIANTWTQLNDFAGAPRLGAAVFVIAGKAYIGMGQGKDVANNAIVFNDLWRFDLGDPNVWSQKASLPADGRYLPAAFSIGSTGYLGGGDNLAGGPLADFWQYNPYADSWLQKADLGGGPRAVVPGVSLNGKGYVGSGGPVDFWQYNPSSDSWSQKASIANGRIGAIAVSVNGKIFLGTGLGGGPLKDFYAYTPDIDPVLAGTMYGPTVNGGNVSTESGVIFKASSTGTGVTSIYNFDLSAINGTNPWGRLVDVNGKLYGTTPIGGNNVTGVVYQLDLNGNVYTRLTELLTYNGSGAYGGLTFAGGKLYGLSRGGSGAPDGFIFELDPATNTFTKKASFNGTNGSDPYGGEFLLVGNKLYGVTMSGGASGLGVIFEYNFRTNTITKKADFTGTNGSQPRGGLTEFSGMLYGVTSAGGNSDKGVLFEFDMNSGTIIKRKDFAGNDGEVPYGALTVLNDKLYGTTSNLGTGFMGLIFEYDPASQTFTKKFDFDNTSAYTGGHPYGAMTTINGKLYGTTIQGGDNNKGALFSYDITNGFSKIFNFDDVNGAGSVSGVTFVRDNQTLTFDPLPSKVFGDAPFQLTATGSLGFPVQFYSSNENVATINGSTVTITGAGTTTITAYIGRDNHFTTVNQNLFIDKKAQTITFNSLSVKTFGDASFQLNATASSSLTVSYSSDNTAVATLSGNTITIVGAGTATITAKQPGNTEYNAAVDVPQVLTVAKANQSITFGQLPQKTYGDTPLQLSATSTSGLAVVFASGNTPVGSVSGTTLTIGNAGTAVVTASQPGNTNYNAATPVQNTLTVAKAVQVITFNALPTKTLGDAPFTLTGTALFDAPTYTSSNLSVATISGTNVTITGSGQTDISASYAGSANVLPAVTVTRTLTVKANQVITFNPLGTITYTPTLQLTATTNSGLPIQYTSETPSVATISGNTATIVGVGTTKITASQPGNGSFNAASDVSQILTVTKANQTITFNAINDQKFGDPKFNLSATSTSGLTVNFSTTSDKIQLSGTEVTIVAAGSVSISATQAGNAFYNAAPAMQRNFCIAPAKPVVSLSNNNTATPLLTSSAPTGNQWYLDGTAISGATSQTLTVSKAGSYKVQVSIDGCLGDFSESFVMSVTAIEEQPTEGFTIYPNPVDNKLTVAIPFHNGSTVSVLRADGSVVQTYQTSSSILEVDVSNFASGLYLLNIHNDRSQYFGKFIKK